MMSDPHKEEKSGKKRKTTVQVGWKGYKQKF